MRSSSSTDESAAIAATVATSARASSAGSRTGDVANRTYTAGADNASASAGTSPIATGWA